MSDKRSVDTLAAAAVRADDRAQEAGERYETAVRAAAGLPGAIELINVSDAAIAFALAVTEQNAANARLRLGVVSWHAMILGGA